MDCIDSPWDLSLSPASEARSGSLTASDSSFDLDLGLEEIADADRLFQGSMIQVDDGEGDALDDTGLFSLEESNASSQENENVLDDDRRFTTVENMLLQSGGSFFAHSSPPGSDRSLLTFPPGQQLGTKSSLRPLKRSI